MKQKLTMLIVSLISALVFVPSASAVTVPQFPSCLNPQGSVIASYNSGVHGIVGSSGTFTGADKVYAVDAIRIVQCFCPDNGPAIQTNWLKASDMTDTDVEILKNSGWYFVPNGAAWGLDNAPYLAKNSNYTCKSTANGTSSSTGGGSSSSSSSSSSSTGGASNDLGSKVLGLAFTGSSEYIYKLWLYGLVALLLGVWIKRFNARKKSSQ